MPKEPEVAGYDLFYYGYDTREQAPFSALELIRFLQAIAEDPAVQVVNPSLATGLPQRPRGFRYQHIVIAAHSLGAVVSRLALLDSLTEDRQPKPWLRQVRLVLFAPAHSGAPAVKLASLLLLNMPVNGMLEAIARKRYKSIGDVETGSQTLAQLLTGTKKLLDNPPDASLVGCHRAWVAHGGKDYIVSALKFGEDRNAYPMSAADHLEVCKPTLDNLEPMDFLLEAIP